MAFEDRSIVGQQRSLLQMLPEIRRAAPEFPQEIVEGSDVDRGQRVAEPGTCSFQLND
jgi:hypothetical protein